MAVRKWEYVFEVRIGLRTRVHTVRHMSAYYFQPIIHIVPAVRPGAYDPQGMDRVIQYEDARSRSSPVAHIDVGHTPDAAPDMATRLENSHTLDQYDATISWAADSSSTITPYSARLAA